MKPKRLLIMDEQPQRLLALLQEAGFEASEAGSMDEAMDKTTAAAFDLLLLDGEMAGKDGLAVLEKLIESSGSAPTIIMTSADSIEVALKTGRLGIEQYLVKPLDSDELFLKIEEALMARDLENIKARRERIHNLKFDFRQFLGKSPAMIALKERLALVALAETVVLITGEPGTGKEMAARAIHNNSRRKTKPFVAINCSALSENQLERELFGQEKDSSSGALQTMIGELEIADGGTIFLDEVGDLTPTIQARLIRVMEDMTFVRNGGETAIKVDVRILAATNRDLEAERDRDTFRQYLFDRLNMIQVIMPSLRERGPGDIMLLADHLIEEAANRNQKNIKSFSPRAAKALIANPWPGNVRELLNTMERAVKLARGDEIDLEDLPPTVQFWSSWERRKEIREYGFVPGMTIKQVEAELIQSTLFLTKGNRTKTAGLLGVTRQTLLNKIKEYGLE